jgi:hypothetical protein
MDFYDWAMQAWIQELDTISSQFYKVIHMLGFDTNLSDTKNGIVLQPSPDISSLRMLSNLDRGEQHWFGHDERKNHFSEHNNIKLAEAVAYAIINTNKDYTGTLYFNNLDKWNFKK